ncbi:MAG: HAMP domain-containing protein [Coriobacteriia bacterium]|nr:HAMP domain-containing protein [Coriobacteriia bacterium]
MTRLRSLTSTFRARLIIGYLLVAAVFALAWGWSLYTPLTEAALRQQTRALTSVATAGSLVAEESTLTAATLVKRLTENSDLRVTIVAADGTVLADSVSDPATMENHSNRPEVKTALSGSLGTDSRISKTQGVRELYVAVPARLTGASVALRVSQPFAEIDAASKRSRGIGLALLAVALVLAIAIAAWASAAASRPVADLSEAARRMAAGDLATPIPEVPGDLSALADALTQLRAEIRARIDALEAEQRTLRMTLDGLTDAVFLLDGETLEYVNSAAGTLFRQPGGGWRNQSIADVGLPETLAAALSDAISGRGPEAVEIGPDPLGSTYRLLVVRLHSGGSIAVVSDVTQRAQLDAVRRDFVANASHELKTPVAGIQLLAESAATAAGDSDIEVALQFTRQIDAEAQRLKRLVADLLDLSRLDTVPDPQAVTNVRVAVDNALTAHASAAARASLDLRSDLSSVRGQDVFVALEATDLAIALDNLIDNALAYTDSGVVSVRVTADNARVTIRVEDTGPGIEARHLPRLFERFYRVDGARTREGGGTGLGLALVKHVSERGGGSIDVASTPGAGSAFTLSLPRAH